ncbi:cellulose synthase [Paraburkholderia sp. Ac-20336]|uniref:cellulose synthase n=1 Tax=Paraburkholderia sp. Ac-20336 TaxID=2703886 RepID=UPI00197F9AB4|nr:cellulose synthase [Paraburkholderia sp. Ac-20336]MBN3802512.1 cellulose synthase [Paraburkholderia sp. Ac-20336]
MNSQKLKVLQVINRSGIARKTGNAWSIFSAQCVLEQEVDGKPQLLVGTINLPDALKDTEPGDYLANFAFFQSMEGRLEPRITSLQPWGRPMARPKSDAVPA